MLFVISASAQVNIEDEEELIKKAEKLFKKESFVEAMPLYSQLTSVYPENSTYNYKYGACLLYGEEDKSISLKYLKFAVEHNEQEPLAKFYLAHAYHLNYQFDKAIKYYKSYIGVAKAKEVEEREVQRLITQCENGNDLLRNARDISIYNKRKINRADFFRAYELNAFKGKIVVVPDDFKSDLDKKKEFTSVIVHHPDNQVIYYSSYGEKGTGGKDIYKVLKLPNGDWSQPINLGPVINTLYDEEFPYMHPDGKTFYFASKGHDGIGGYDVFKSEYNETTSSWSKPKNLGFAFNSPDDDFLYISDESESIAFFASRRSNNMDEVTVYKVSAMPKVVEYSVVKAEFVPDQEVEGKVSITVTDMDKEVLEGVYNIGNSNNTMLVLRSGGKYQYDIVVEGRSPQKAEVIIPLQTEMKELNQKIYYKVYPQDHVVIESDFQETVASIEDIASLIQKRANLEINSKKDIQFNSIQPSANNEELTALSSEEEEPISNTPISNREIVKSALADADEYQAEAEMLKKRSDAAFVVAASKNEKSKELAKEIEQLIKRVDESSDNSEKAKLTDEINAKEEQLENLSKEVVVAYNIAKRIESDAEEKEKQASFSKSYAEDLEAAIMSNSAEEAIERLEAKKEELDAMIASNQISTDFSTENMTQDIEDRKSKLDEQSSDVNNEILAIEEERKALEAQKSSTKNDALKEEFQYQIDDLSDELIGLKSKQEKLNKEKIQLDKELEVIGSSSTLLTEISSLESDELGLAEIQKVNEAKKVLPNEVETIEKTGSTEELVSTLSEAAINPQFSSDDNNPHVDEVQSNLANVDRLEGKENPEYEFNNFESTIDSKQSILKGKKQELALLKDARSNVTDEEELKKLDEQIAQVESRIQNEEIAIVQTKQQAEAYAKDQDLQLPESLNLTSEELVIAQGVSTQEKNVESSNTNDSQNNSGLIGSTTNSNSSNSSINPTNPNNSSSSNNSNNQQGTSAQNIASNQTQGNNNEESINSEELASNITNTENKVEEEGKVIQDNVVNEELASNEGQNIEEEKSESSNNSEDSIANEGTENGQNPAVASSNPEVQEEELLAAQKELNIPEVADEEWQEIIENYNPNSSSNEMVKKGMSKVYGLYSDPDFTYRDDAIVQANVRNARRIEREALKKVVEAERLEKEASQETGSKAKKLLKEAEKLRENAKLDLLTTTQNYLIANREEYKRNKEDVKNAFLSGEITDNYGNRQKQEKMESLWEKAQMFREKAEAESDPERKILLINQAYDNELRAIEIQQEFIGEEARVARFNAATENEDLAKENQLAENANIPQYQQDSIANQVDSVLKINDADLVYATSQDFRVKAAQAPNDSIKNYYLNQANSLDEAFQAQKDQESIAAINESKDLIIEKETLLNEIKVEEEDTENPQLIMAKMYQTEIDYYGERLEEAEKSMMESDNDQIRQSNMLEIKRLQKEVLTRQDKLLAIYENNNPTITPAQKADAQRLASGVTTSGAGNEESLTSSSNGNSTDVSTTDGITNATSSEELASSETGSDQEGNAEGNAEDNSQETESALATTKGSGLETDESTNDSSDNKLDEPSENELIGTNSGRNSENSSNADASNQGDVPVEYIDVYTNYYSLLKEADSDLQAAQDQLADSKKESEEAMSLLSQADQALLEVEDADDESEIEALIQKADQLKSQAESKKNRADELKKMADSNSSAAKSKKLEAENYLNNQSDEAIAAIKSSEGARSIEDNFNDYDEDEAALIALSNQVESSITNDQPGTRNNVETAGQNGGVSQNTSKTTSNSGASNTSNTFFETATSEALPLPNGVNGPIALMGSSNSDQSVFEEGIQFNSSSTYSDQNPIPVDPVMPDGLVFKVQVGAFRQPIPQNSFEGINPLMGEKTPMGFIRYTAGFFRAFESADMAKKEIRGKGYRDAFVVAFYNGKRISLYEAKALLANASQEEKDNYADFANREIARMDANNIGKNYNDPSVAEIARNIRDLKGVLYTVQVGYYNRPIAGNELEVFKPLLQEPYLGGIRYTTGVFTNKPEAIERKNKARTQGVPDAFVRAYNNGQPVSIAEADQLIAGGAATNDNQNSGSPTNSNSGSDGSSSNGTVGLSFKVQIGAYREQVPAETAALFVDLAPFGISFFTNDNGLTIYAIGDANTLEEASAMKQKAIEVGIVDAFVTPYFNGERISMSEARAKM